MTCTHKVNTADSDVVVSGSSDKSSKDRGDEAGQVESPLPSYDVHQKPCPKCSDSQTRVRKGTKDTLLIGRDVHLLAAQSARTSNGVHHGHLRDTGIQNADSLCPAEIQQEAELDISRDQRTAYFRALLETHACKEPDADLISPQAKLVNLAEMSVATRPSKYRLRGFRGRMLSGLTR